MTLIYLIAGEASGDLLGARLIAALRAARPDLTFAGVGGDRMAEQGFSSLFPMRELAVMGLAEVLPNIRRLSRRLDETTADILARRPGVVVTIDSPGFGLRIAARVRPRGFRVLHYVAPQVWAWRPGRVKRIAKEVDRILALLPFEAPFFEKAGIPVDFVGHSILESGADQGDAARFRAKHNIAPDERVVLVMPGSRRSEVGRLLPTFGAALKLAAQQMPKLRPVVPLAGPVEEAVRATAAHWHPAPILVQDVQEKYDAFAAAAAGLIKSGTSSLEVALAGVPMVVGYRVNPLTAIIARRLVKVPHISIVNLLAERRIIPELVQEDCTPEKLSAELVRLLTDPAAAAAQREGFATVFHMLRPAEGLPSAAAAAAVLRALEPA
ncbi:lipid-A-disaccharide synthase [Pseudoroseomonas wenyumeiae]|uniref:Lipid-A-disaccharide synthase n=1 Tax=Teichococcus wenyumeiae TaxID=2478470 RepID=A0A3A9JEK7_9PROT|nr:lipid-A-disaccharide synthase [Pseudoroseomonas wenyumeiae]RKK03811.1 lipid-A-disaccharide synthase [Pseudoroseomonas wenyumeiae]RMI24722.1 lipid-A-disaccharide synthase [Pseudoroseomonas wenyumeiae]